MQCCNASQQVVIHHIIRGAAADRQINRCYVKLLFQILPLRLGVLLRAVHLVHGRLGANLMYLAHGVQSILGHLVADEDDDSTHFQIDSNQLQNQL